MSDAECICHRGPFFEETCPVHLAMRGAASRSEQSACGWRLSNGRWQAEGWGEPCVEPRDHAGPHAPAAEAAQSPQVGAAHAIGLAEAWPASDVLDKLADAAEHLMSGHSCDTHGHELVSACIPRAREYAKRFRALSAEPGRSDSGSPPAAVASADPELAKLLRRWVNWWERVDEQADPTRIVEDTLSALSRLAGQSATEESGAPK